MSLCLGVYMLAKMLTQLYEHIPQHKRTQHRRKSFFDKVFILQQREIVEYAVARVDDVTTALNISHIYIYTAKLRRATKN